jgi:hypothetical protein
MAFIENPRQPLINPFAFGDSSHVKYTESLPSTMIAMTPSLTPTISSIEPSKRMKLKKNKIGLRQRLFRKQNSLKDIFMINMSHRLGLRKDLHNRL